MPIAPETRSTHARRRGLTRVLVAVLLPFAAALAFFLIRRESAGARSPREAVEGFVSAAAQRDADRIARLARRGPYPVDTQEAFSLVPLGARAEQVDVQMPFGPDVAFTQVRGTAGGQPWSARFTVNQRSSRWFVAVGTVPSSRTPSSTTPPPR